MKMWESERRLGAASGVCEDTKIEKYSKKCTKSTYDSLEAGEIYGVWVLKSENGSDGETFVSDVRWFWKHKDWEIQRKCVKLSNCTLQIVEIYRVWELKGENVRDRRCLWVTSGFFFWKHNEMERCLGVTSDACKGSKIEKYREKCMKLTYGSLALEKYTELGA